MFSSWYSSHLHASIFHPPLTSSIVLFLYLFVLPYLLLSSPAPLISFPLPLFLPLSLPPDLYFNKLLRIMSTRCMMPAEYFCSGEIDKSQVRRNMQRLHHTPHLEQLISLFVQPCPPLYLDTTVSLHFLSSSLSRHQLLHPSIFTIPYLSLALLVPHQFTHLAQL
jgi:hypothetical protein